MTVYIIKQETYVTLEDGRKVLSVSEVDGVYNTISAARRYLASEREFLGRMDYVTGHFDHESILMRKENITRKYMITEWAVKR